MQRTVGEIRNMLAGLPADLPVDFVPITSAWLGASNPMRFQAWYCYDNEGNGAEVGGDGTQITVHLVEDHRPTP